MAKIRYKWPNDTHFQWRGLLHRRHYYLPTSDGQLNKIDLATGKLVKSVAMGAALGNLARDGDRLITYDGARVQSFYIAESLARRVDARLKEQPDDAWALARQGELMLAAGDAEGALRWLRRSLAQEKADETRQSIVAVTLQLLRADAKRYVESGESALALAEEPQERIELLRQIALGYAAGGQPRQAFAFCLPLADEFEKQPASSRPIFVEPEPGHRVSIDRWLQAMIVRLERQIADEPDPYEVGQ